ncbi:TetR/AcrR family transcriptional regulator [Nocardia sp. BMG111209]|uniref:TetR/AcrR family transcriptional regulator n=1 Tax=Nocardia sp. BMG111209 TaxID=1160137 RepID=UPI00035EB2CA|nr:TetR/AcrR family transcriptional regulator [Nocardia sp. BMG111209]
MTPKPVPARRGRPRDERAHVAILDAAARLLVDRGPAMMSMDAVAAAAGVSKATIYRWWPSKEALAMDALYREWDTGAPAEPVGPLREDLRNMLLPWVILISGRPYGPVVAGLLAEVLSTPAFALEYRSRFVEHRREHGRLILQQAIARGEISPRTRTEVVLDLLYGPIYHRMLHGHGTLDTTFVDDVIDTVLDGIHPRA